MGMGGLCGVAEWSKGSAREKREHGGDGRRGGESDKCDKVII